AGRLRRDRLGEYRRAEPIAKRLDDRIDRHRAAEALKALGRKAEKAVLPYLTHADWQVRWEACKVLTAIGTKASKTALEKANGDSNGLVRLGGKKALAAGRGGGGGEGTAAGGARGGFPPPRAGRGPPGRPFVPFP